MSRWRIVIVMLLLALPVAFLAGWGGYELWIKGWLFWASWPILGCFVAGVLLAWYWQRSKVLLRPPDPAPPHHWTERDAQAWQLVQERAKQVDNISAKKLADMQIYLDTGKEMADELARFYHPRASDPVGNLTIPEILAVIELAAHDMAVLVDRYLPGGHLMTVNDYRFAQKATNWYGKVSNAYWMIAALFSPVNTGLRYAASRVGLSQPLQMLQNNLLAWFYTAYVHRLGTYLIEVHSGRLRVGATRYRALLESQLASTTNGEKQAEGVGKEQRAGDEAHLDSLTPADKEAIEQVSKVTVTVMGQVKAGKSSLINAFLGEQRALADVLPATAGVEQYELQPPSIPTQLVLLDTVGYGHEGPREDQVAVTRSSAQQSDLVLLVLHARNPARQADVDALRDLHRYFATRPHLKRPPILAVLTHMDLLSPAMEWAPPYEWQTPTRPKEKNIHQAVLATREQLADLVTDVIPVCSAPERTYGVQEWLLPVIAQRLDEVHAVALLRCLRAEVDTGKVRKVFHQLLASGKMLAQATWESMAK